MFSFLKVDFSPRKWNDPSGSKCPPASDIPKELLSAGHCMFLSHRPSPSLAGWIWLPFFLYRRSRLSQRGKPTYPKSHSQCSWFQNHGSRSPLLKSAPESPSNAASTHPLIHIGLHSLQNSSTSIFSLEFWRQVIEWWNARAEKASWGLGDPCLCKQKKKKKNGAPGEEVPQPRSPSRGGGEDAGQGAGPRGWLWIGRRRHLLRSLQSGLELLRASVARVTWECSICFVFLPGPEEMLDERVQQRGLAQLCRGFLVTRGQPRSRSL